MDDLVALDAVFCASGADDDVLLSPTSTAGDPLPSPEVEVCRWGEDEDNDTLRPVLCGRAEIITSPETEFRRGFAVIDCFCGMSSAVPPSIDPRCFCGVYGWQRQGDDVPRSGLESN